FPARASPRAPRSFPTRRSSDLALQGLRAARGVDQPFVSVLAHSYGSTAALLSLAEDDVSVDALAVVGSPGSPARSAAELHVGSVDRKSTRLNSSHVKISYAVFC